MKKTYKLLLAGFLFGIVLAVVHAHFYSYLPFKIFDMIGVFAIPAMITDTLLKTYHWKDAIVFLLYYFTFGISFGLIFILIYFLYNLFFNMIRKANSVKN